MTDPLELLAKHIGVLNDPVMYKRKIAGAVGMWMRVRGVWLTVSSPSGMGDATCPQDGVSSKTLGQPIYTAGELAYRNARPVLNGHSSRVIAPVLKASKAVDKNFSGLP